MHYSDVDSNVNTFRGLVVSQFQRKCPTSFSLSWCYDKLKFVGHQTDPVLRAQTQSCYCQTPSFGCEVPGNAPSGPGTSSWSVSHRITKSRRERRTLVSAFITPKYLKPWNPLHTIMHL